MTLKKVTDPYCNFTLTWKEKALVNRLAMQEFLKPKHLRMLPFQLVELVKKENGKPI